MRRSRWPVRNVNKLQVCQLTGKFCSIRVVLHPCSMEPKDRPQAKDRTSGTVNHKRATNDDKVYGVGHIVLLCNLGKRSDRWSLYRNGYELSDCYATRLQFVLNVQGGFGRHEDVPPTPSIGRLGKGGCYTEEGPLRFAASFCTPASTNPPPQTRPSPTSRAPGRGWCFPNNNNEIQ